MGKYLERSGGTYVVAPLSLGDQLNSGNASIFNPWSDRHLEGVHNQHP